MAGEIQLNGTSFASESGGTITVNNGTLGSSVVFPANTVIGFKFVEIGNQALSGTYTKFNTTTAATSAQGLQVVSTTYDPKSDNSLIYVMANLTVTESSNNDDEAYAALFVGTTNLSQTASQDRLSGNSLEYTVANLSGTFTNSALSQLTVQVRASGDTDEGLNINAMNGDVGYTNSVSYYYKTGLTIMEIQQ